MRAYPASGSCLEGHALLTTRHHCVGTHEQPRVILGRRAAITTSVTEPGFLPSVCHGGPRLDHSAPFGTMLARRSTSGPKWGTGFHRRSMSS